MLIVAPIITLFKPTFSMKTHKKAGLATCLNTLYFILLFQNCTLKFFHPITLKNNSLCSIQTVLTFSLG